MTSREGEESKNKHDDASRYKSAGEESLLEPTVGELKQQILALQLKLAVLESSTTDSTENVHDDCDNVEHFTQGNDEIPTQKSFACERVEIQCAGYSKEGGIEENRKVNDVSSRRSSGKNFHSIPRSTLSKHVGSTRNLDESPAKRRSISESIHLKSFFDTVRSAVSASQSHGLERRAFWFFSLISAGEEMIKNSSDDAFLIQGGVRFLDPFQFDETKVLDFFPKPSNDAENAPLFTPKDLSSFCTPCGITARLIPKVAMERARKMGLTGRFGDRYEILVFTDSSCETRTGVAITCKEEVDSSVAVENLVLLRKRRWAAVSIVRWWKKLYKNKGSDINGIFGKWSRPDSSTGTTSASDSKQLWLRSSLGGIRNSLLRRSSLDASAPRSESPTSVAEKRTETKIKPGKRNAEVTLALRNFFKSSSLPMYEAEKKRGTWIAAKLKKCRWTGEILVVVKYAPLAIEDESNLPFNFKRKLEEEQQRLVHILKDISIAPKDEPENTNITRVELEECHESLSLSTIEKPVGKHGVISRCKAKAREAYQEMVRSENLGDVFVVEKCYILLGGQPKEQSLLLASLQKLVDFERNAHSFDVTGVGPSICREKHVERRNHILEFIRDNCVLSPQQIKLCHPPTEIGHATWNPQRFELDLPIPGATSINLPLPLPQVTSKWALCLLLFRIGSNSLMKVLNSLLRERSLLIVGRSRGEVSICAMALKELIEPYAWPNTFLPMLPPSSLDLILSPVPFIVGTACESIGELTRIMSGETTAEALSNGMSLLDLTCGTLKVSAEFEDEDQLLPILSPGLSDSLQSLQKRLEELSEQDGSSLQKLKTSDPVLTFESLRSFVHSGLTKHESLTLSRAKEEISAYMSQLGGDLHVNKSSWSRYGHFNDVKEFFYEPNMFLEPMRVRLKFMEEMTHTQLFSYSVNTYREKDFASKKKRESAGRKISYWLSAKRKATVSPSP